MSSLVPGNETRIWIHSQKGEISGLNSTVLSILPHWAHIHACTILYQINSPSELESNVQHYRIIHNIKRDLPQLCKYF